MAKRFNTKALDILLDGTREQRVYLCSLDPKYFAAYYFPEYMDYKLGDYHFDFFEDMQRIAEGGIDEAAWVAYRESAKTSIAKICLCWLICYAKKKYINVDSYDKSNAEAILFDVTISMQTNRKLIADFGQLYYRKKGAQKGEEEDEGSTMKRLGAFITENGVKVEAHSTQEPTRGRLFKNQRPDFYLIDDIENNKTAESPVITENVIAHLDELKAGLASNAGVLYLGNLIVDDGSVAHIMASLARNKERSVVRNIPVILPSGEIAWPDKYVHTDREALELNKDIKDVRKRKVSLETKRRQLGERVFMREMMNEPGSAEDAYFDRDIIRKALERARPPVKRNGALNVWVEHNPAHSYGIGADTGSGQGLDANTSIVIDYTRRPNLIVGSSCDANMPPNIFGRELARQGALYGECLLAPEANNTGWATTAVLADLDYPNLYERGDPLKKDQTTKTTQGQYGYLMRSGMKHDLFGHFKSAFEDGDLEIWDAELLTEMMRFRKADLSAAARDTSSSATSRHFDRLIAAVIAWEVKDSAILGKEDPRRVKMFKSPQKPYQGLLS